MHSGRSHADAAPHPTTQLLAKLRRSAALVLSGIMAANAAFASPVDTDEVDEATFAAWSATPRPLLGQGGSEALVSAARRNGTIVELPSRSISKWTPDQVYAALGSADNGSLAAPADLVEAIMGDDRVQGVLSTRTLGLLGLDLQFYGPEEQTQALEGARSSTGQVVVPGDFSAMFPANELAKLAAWGILLGVGLGERVPDEEREIGQRSVPVLRVWHPRWLRHDWVTDTWHLMTAQGEIEIHPGDGRWILFQPYGCTRPWAHGAWRPIAFAWVLKQFALHDRARHSEVQGGTARIGKAPQGAKEPARKKFLKDLRAMGRESTLVLPEGYSYEIVEATSRNWEIYGAQIEWADRAISIVLAGQFVTTEGTKGFSNGNIHAAIKEDLIRFTAETLAACLYAQGLRPWANENWGSPQLAPHAHWDTTPPEDKKALAESFGALGDAIGKLAPHFAVMGYRVAVLELATKFGVPVERMAYTPPAPPSGGVS